MVLIRRDIELETLRERLETASHTIADLQGKLSEARQVIEAASQSAGDLPGAHTDVEILTVDEVSYMLKLHRRTIYKLIARRTLPAYRIGGDWRFVRSEVVKAIRNGGVK